MRITRRTLFGLALGVFRRTHAALVERNGSDHERAFRAGRFQSALAFADRALARDSHDVSAILTKVRVYDTNFITELAEEEYARAVAAGRDLSLVLLILPDLSFAEKREDLIKRYLEQNSPDSLGHERMRGLRMWLDRAGNRLCSASDSIPQDRCAALKLNYGPQHPGLIGVMVRVNGNKPVRLLLNSSALGLWMKPEKARSLGVTSLGEGWISEPGVFRAVPGIYGFADQVEIGGMVIKNVPVFEGDADSFKLWDGVIGISTFRNLMVRLYASEPAILFESLPVAPLVQRGERTVPSVLASAVRCVRSRHILLLPGNVQGRTELMLLQLQAEASVVHRPILSEEPDNPYRHWLTGYSCADGEHDSTETVNIDLGGGQRSVLVRDCNLSDIASKLRLPVSGVIGMNFFRHQTIVLEQTHGLVVFV